MFTISGLVVQFSGVDLFRDISFLVNGKDKIGLVGKNGVGKSTLMKIIAGQQQPEAGTVVIPAGKQVGYLPQELSTDSRLSIFEEVLSVFGNIRQLEQEIEDISKQLTARTDYESEAYSMLITRMTEKGEQLDQLDRGKIEGRIERILKGMGFMPEDFGRPLSEFSGGWQMRVELSKLLLQMPALLLLDEPTNHLDIESIIWLEDFLKSYPGAIMMVSHDRTFLDAITGRTIEMVAGKIYDYSASYSRFVALREERLSTQKAAYKNQQKHILQQKRFIERFRAKNTKAKQVQSKIKQLNKLQRVEFDQVDKNSIQFRFPPAPRSGDVVLTAKGLSKSYGSNLILQNLDIIINRGERIAFVGKNGEGKSTLVKLITGEEDYEGALKLGHNVNIGYHAQEQEHTLDGNATVFETIDNLATGEWRTISKIRGLLGAFLFSKDDTDKKVKVLSGGEKSRLALARLLLNPVNLLILDEPTNHLDMTAKEVLKNALMNYNGTLILVSHDRDFLQGLTDRTFEFGNKTIKDRLGDINVFLNAYQVESFRLFESMNKGKSTKVLAKTSSENKRQYEKKKAADKELRKTKTALTKCERGIEELEREIAQIETQMARQDFYDNRQDAQKTLDRDVDARKALSALMSDWVKLSERQQQLEKES